MTSTRTSGAVGHLLIGAVTGAAAGLICVLAAFALHPALVLDMDRDQPGLMRGFYPPERQGDVTFAWTSAQAVLDLPRFTRAAPWECLIRLRGARPEPNPQPLVDVGVDGVTAATLKVTNSYQDLAVTVPARSESGLTLSIASDPVFIPGGTDRRGLGAQVDRLTCAPLGRLVFPPSRVIASAAVSAAAFGAAFGWLAPTLWWTVGAVLLLAAAQALPLTAGPAPYSALPDTAVWMAGVTALVMAGSRAAIEGWRPRPMDPAARSVVMFSGAVLFLKLLALLHPSKLLIDALFHAHRLEWVMAGRYYFTQPMPSGVQFPYAIALYVFAAPWAAFTRDHVALLRIVVAVCQAVAGATLYPMIARTWHDRRAAVIAVMLFHTVPLPYLIMGNANLTHAFAQSAALMTLAAATVWTLGSGGPLLPIGLALLASVAFLAHVGDFPILLSTLVCFGLLCRWAGGAALSKAGSAVLLATTIAVGVSVAAYYGHFADTYRTLEIVRGGRAPASAPAGSASPASGQPARGPGARPVASRTLIERVARVGTLGVSALGWPLSLLAIAGAWRRARQPNKDRLDLLIVASLATGVLFLGASAVLPVEPQFQRYTDEYVQRVCDATAPALVVLAAAAVAWAWEAGTVARLAAGGLLIAASALAIQAWWAWLA